MKNLTLIFIAVLFCNVLVNCHIHHHSKQRIDQKIGSTKIMYGTTIRLKNVASGFHLHSHHVNYPQNSGLQSVTGFPGDNDYNSLWTIKQANDQTVKTYYHEIKCGQTIRLEHALTKKNLHSEQIYQSMISAEQQISAFGSEGEGNDNDNWILRCIHKKQGEQFYGGDLFELVHENTEKRLKTNHYHQYSYMNWQNCPFQGQTEVSGIATHNRQTQWKIVGGVFFQQSNKKNEDVSSYEEQQL